MIRSMLVATFFLLAGPCGGHAQEANPACEGTSIRLAALLRAGNWESLESEARALLKKGVCSDAERDAGAYQYLAIALNRLGREHESLAVSRACQGKHPERVGCYVEEGASLRELRDPPGCVNRSLMALKVAAERRQELESEAARIATMPPSEAEAIRQEITKSQTNELDAIVAYAQAMVADLCNNP